MKLARSNSAVLLTQARFRSTKDKLTMYGHGQHILEQIDQPLSKYAYINKCLLGPQNVRFPLQNTIPSSVLKRISNQQH